MVTGSWLANWASRAGSPAPSSTSPGDTTTVQHPSESSDSSTRFSKLGTQEVTVGVVPAHDTVARGPAQVSGPSGGCGPSR